MEMFVYQIWKKGTCLGKVVLHFCIPEFTMDYPLDNPFDSSQCS